MTGTASTKVTTVFPHVGIRHGQRTQGTTKIGQQAGDVLIAGYKTQTDVLACVKRVANNSIRTA